MLIASLSRYHGSWTPNRVLGGLFNTSYDQKSFEAMPSILCSWDCQKQNPGQGSLNHHRSQVPALSPSTSLVRIDLAPLYLCLGCCCHPHLLKPHSGRPLCSNSWHNSIFGSPSSQIHKRIIDPSLQISNPQSSGLTLHRNNVAQVWKLLYSGLAIQVHLAGNVLQNLMYL